MQLIIYQSTLHTIQLNTTIYKKIQKLTTLESKELIHEDDQEIVYKVD